LRASDPCCSGPRFSLAAEQEHESAQAQLVVLKYVHSPCFVVAFIGSDSFSLFCSFFSPLLFSSSSMKQESGTIEEEEEENDEQPESKERTQTEKSSS
jgi:hypothetical protein